MMKKLQLYTLIIVIIVIALSQYTIFNDSDSYDDTNQIEVNSEAEATQDQDSSKYSEPLEDIGNVIKDAKKTAENLNNNMDTVKKLLDIQKSVDDLSNAFK